MTMPISTAAVNYIKIMATKPGTPGFSLAKQNPFFPNNSSFVINDLTKYLESLIAEKTAGHSVPSRTFTCPDLTPALDKLTCFHGELAGTASKLLKTKYALMTNQDTASLFESIDDARKANARLSQGSIDISKVEPPDLHEVIESLQSVRRFLDHHVSWAQHALEGRNAAEIYFGFRSFFCSPNPSPSSFSTPSPRGF